MEESDIEDGGSNSDRIFHFPSLQDDGDDDNVNDDDDNVNDDGCGDNNDGSNDKVVQELTPFSEWSYDSL